MARFITYRIRLPGKNKEAFLNLSENGLRDWGKEIGFRFLFCLGVGQDEGSDVEVGRGLHGLNFLLYPK